MGGVLLEAWKLAGKGDYFYLLQVALRSLIFLNRFFSLFPLLVLGEDLSTYDVGIVLGLQDLVF